MTTNPASDFLLTRHKGNRKPFLGLRDGRTISYADFVALTGRMANTLTASGVRPGDRVVSRVAKSAEALALCSACLRAGAVAAPLNPSLASGTAMELAKGLEPALIVCAGDGARDMPGLAPQLTLEADGSGTLLQDAMAKSADFETVPRAEDDLALILFTSGTTGRPKGCMLTQRNLLFSAQSLARAWQITDADIILHFLPIYHTHGLHIAANTAMAAGASLIFMSGFSVPEDLDALSASSVVMGIPTLYRDLLACEQFGADLTRNVRLFISGGAPLSAKLVAEFERRTGHLILERHGMTEISVAVSNPAHGARRVNTVGLPLPGISVRISGDTNRHEEGVGLVEIKGPNVFSGYWNDPERTAKAFTEDGYFITGDVGRLDADGYLEILSRSDDLIVSNGQHVIAGEVEAIIEDMPAVQEAAIVGVSHPQLGLGLVGVVVPKPGNEISERDVLDHLHSRLPPDVGVERVFLAAELPRGTTGKIQKRRLRELYEGTFSERPGAMPGEIQGTMMIRKLEMTEAILEAKIAKKLSWEEISKAAGMSDVFVVSACLGQNTLPAEAAAKVVEYLGLGNRAKDVEIALQMPPKKGQEAETVSKDPLIYRFYEITYVYGETIKELIHEEFGDGIMSAIDFDLKVDRVPNPKGDRVQVTMSGKFLPYNQW